ncbi:28S ribosomal protein S6, mitochondrial [Peromyscus leucopus]|nr:28S ribosomal protein S6, mitochondrial [Peromyscus leucopus]
MESDLRSEEAFDHHVLEDVPHGTQSEHNVPLFTREPPPDHTRKQRRPRFGRRGGGGERVRVERGCGLPRDASDRVRVPRVRGGEGGTGREPRPGGRAGTRGSAGAGALRARGGAGPGGRDRPGWAGRPFCAAARAFKPPLARSQRAVAARELTGPLLLDFPPTFCSPRPRPRRLATPARLLHSAPRSRAMPRYELALILKAMRRPETAAALKRTLESLMDRGAIVRNLENLGERVLPYKISSHGQQHSRGGYFLVDFYAPTSAVESILDHLARDIDVVRPNVVKHPLTQEVKECGGIVPVPLEEKLYSTKRRKK